MGKSDLILSHLSFAAGNPTTIEIMHRDEITLNKKDNSLATDIDGDHQKLVFKCLCHSSETHSER
jgi:hypothetical protein